jgi:hypothetical protein
LLFYKLFSVNRIFLTVFSLTYFISINVPLVHTMTMHI